MLWLVFLCKGYILNSRHFPKCYQNILTLCSMAITHMASLDLFLNKPLSKPTSIRVNVHCVTRRSTSQTTNLCLGGRQGDNNEDELPQQIPCLYYLIVSKDCEKIALHLPTIRESQNFILWRLFLSATKTLDQL